MKILELEIENVRGIRNRITLKPNGENFVIYGPNGTGKSAVVDAMDFLFTGDISRLAGRGTKGISLKDHGPHIDTEPKEAVVTAKIKINDIDKPITLKRVMSKPKELICSEIEKGIIEETLEIAEKGQHVLSRSEILKYIAAEAGKRAEEIQAILNLDILEEIRKTFVTIKREADRAVQTDKANHETSIAIIKLSLEMEEFSENEILKKVNECRVILKGELIDALDLERLKDGISPITKDEKDRVDSELLKRTLAAATKLIHEKGNETYEVEKKLRQTIKALKEDERLKRDLAGKRLLDLGISLIDETGSCPLCLTKWEPGKLETFLRERLLKAKEAEEIEEKIRKLATQNDTEITKLRGYINTIAIASEKLKLEEVKENLEQWKERLTKWSDNLRQSVEDYPTAEVRKESFITFLADEYWEESLRKLVKTAEGIEKLPPEQKAWDALTELRPILKRYFDEKKKYENSKRFAERATVLSKTYTDTKDRVLESLYNSVNQDFTLYYRFLHGEDEKSFYAELKPEGSQLDFKVDFYGRGTHHPRALHSEGHQDSMGLCLYLALNKQISEEKVKLIILDDVVMSIDNNHRRNICRLLKHHFPQSQFIITTHNRTWARQLNTDSVVKSRNMVEFRGWTVETGPNYEEGKNVWEDIQRKLERNEIASAAHQLREHAEFFYENACDSLKAEVCYRSDGRWELGDFLSGAKKAYKENLKLAKNAANSWGKREEVEAYTEIESQVNEIIQRTQMEHWGINENIHYTKWIDFTKEDFLPIMEAFQDLEGMFKCFECQTIISLNTKGVTLTNVKCPCGKIFWNLEFKK
jgi:recombinational DNA repair ATPase RecF